MEKVNLVHLLPSGGNLTFSRNLGVRNLKLASMKMSNSPGWEGRVGWEVFRYRRACFSELQNTTYTEGAVLLILSKDEVRKSTLLAICSDTPAQLQNDECVCAVPLIRTNSKFLSTAFKQWRSPSMEVS